MITICQLRSKKDRDAEFITLLITYIFDLVLFCADNHDAFSLLRSFGGQEAFHISIARIKHTKFEVLTEICKLVPINGFLYV